MSESSPPAARLRLSRHPRVFVHRIGDASCGGYDRDGNGGAWWRSSSSTCCPLLYISWLGDATLTAGVGLATILVFIATSINVGLMIAVGALVARRLGARQPEEGRRIATSAVIWSFVTAGLATALLMPSAGFILDLMGARGEVHAVALHYCLIVLPGNLTMAVGMACSGYPARHRRCAPRHEPHPDRRGFPPPSSIRS